jgi:hypothetical protein
VVTITAGSTTRNVDFKNKIEGSEPAILAGRKLLVRQIPADGTLDTTVLSGLSGWLIYLDINRNGQFDLDVDTAVSTEDNGVYRFKVRPGLYVIRELLKPGWMQIRPGPSEDYAHVVTVGPGEIQDNLHFVNASLDRDGDSVTDYDEEIMGTDPFDADAWARPVLTGNPSDGLGLLLDLVPGRLYQIQTTGGLGSGSWVDFGDPLSAAEAQKVFLNMEGDTGSDRPATFYRVKVIKE